MTLDQIKKEAESFFSWPSDKRDQVTYTSCLLFAEHCAKIALKEKETHSRLTKEEAASKQHWRGMDGATAFHLIERHADGWNDVGTMMNAWLEANHIAQARNMVWQPFPPAPEAV